MSKLTKAQARQHARAVELLAKDALRDDEKWEVLENFHASANHINSIAGAFFTPAGLAGDFAIDACGGPRVIDLCAGVGTLAFAVAQRSRYNDGSKQFVCVEKNPDYVAIGRKIMPEAEWICADVFELDLKALGHFGLAIANPPFGATPRSGRGPRYTGKAFEYHVIDMASDIAECGAFIVPQGSAGFVFSGARNYERRESEAYRQFADQTGITFEAGCGVDCAFYRNDWHGVAPSVEIVCANFEELKRPAPIVAPAPAIERTPAGAQCVLPGAEPSPWAELARRRAQARLIASKPQAACDVGLFSDAAAQSDLVDMLRSAKP